LTEKSIWDRVQNPATAVVVIEEVDTDNWGIGGESDTVGSKKDQGLFTHRKAAAGAGLDMEFFLDPKAF